MYFLQNLPHVLSSHGLQSLCAQQRASRSVPSPPAFWVDAVMFLVVRGQVQSTGFRILFLCGWRGASSEGSEAMGCKIFGDQGHRSSLIFHHSVLISFGLSFTRKVDFALGRETSFVLLPRMLLRVTQAFYFSPRLPECYEMKRWQNIVQNCGLFLIFTFNILLLFNKEHL